MILMHHHEVMLLGTGTGIGESGERGLRGRSRRRAAALIAALMAGLLVGGAARAQSEPPAEQPAPVPAPAPTPAPAPAPADGSPTAPPAGEDVPKPTAKKRVEKPPAPGDRVMVIYLDGRRMEGDLVKVGADAIVVKVANLDVTIDLIDITRYFKLESPADRYRQMRATIKDEDFPRLVALAVWLQDNAMYDEALDEVNLVLRSDPSNADALRLRKELVKQVELRDKARDSENQTNPIGPRHSEKGGPAVEAPKRPGLDEFPVLTPEQINIIKVYETNLADPPRIVIPLETVEKLMNRYSDSPGMPRTRDEKDAFKALTPEQILEVMFRVRARDLYNEVRIIDQPSSMKMFRDQIHASWLVNTAAATRCHGGSSAGRLLLTNRRPTSEQSVYTNFLIIDRFRTREGKPLIDWADPEKSILLQMGLPRDEVATPHPDVKGWTPVFRNREDRKYQQAVAWIKSMYRPHPDYPVKYEAPEIKRGANNPPSIPAPKPQQADKPAER